MVDVSVTFEPQDSKKQGGGDPLCCWVILAINGVNWTFMNQGFHLVGKRVGGTSLARCSCGEQRLPLVHSGDDGIVHLHPVYKFFFFLVTCINWPINL